MNKRKIEQVKISQVQQKIMDNQFARDILHRAKLDI